MRAGDTLAWSVQTHLPMGAALFFVLSSVVNGAPTRIQIGGSDGVLVNNYGVAEFAIHTAMSGTWTAGRYDWVAFGLYNGDRTELASGTVTVTPDVAGTSPVDTRSYNRKLLDQVRALLAGKTLDDVSMYKVGERELTKIPLPELRDMEANLEARVRRENRRKQGKSIYRSAPVVFGGR